MSHYEKDSSRISKEELGNDEDCSDSDKSILNFKENEVQFIPVDLHNGGSHAKHSRRNACHVRPLFVSPQKKSRLLLMMDSGSQCLHKKTQQLYKPPNLSKCDKCKRTSNRQHFYEKEMDEVISGEKSFGNSDYELPTEINEYQHRPADSSENFISCVIDNTEVNVCCTPKYTFNVKMRCSKDCSKKQRFKDNSSNEKNKIKNLNDSAKPANEGEFLTADEDVKPISVVEYDIEENALCQPNENNATIRMLINKQEYLQNSFNPNCHHKKNCGNMLIFKGPSIERCHHGEINTGSGIYVNGDLLYQNENFLTKCSNIVKPDNLQLSDNMQKPCFQYPTKFFRTKQVSIFPYFNNDYKILSCSRKIVQERTRKHSIIKIEKFRQGDNEETKIVRTMSSADIRMINETEKVLRRYVLTKHAISSSSESAVLNSSLDNRPYFSTHEDKKPQSIKETRNIHLRLDETQMEICSKRAMSKSRDDLSINTQEKKYYVAHVRQQRLSNIEKDTNEKNKETSVCRYIPIDDDDQQKLQTKGLYEQDLAETDEAENELYTGKAVNPITLKQFQDEGEITVKSENLNMISISKIIKSEGSELITHIEGLPKIISKSEVLEEPKTKEGLGLKIQVIFSGLPSPTRRTYTLLTGEGLPTKKSKLIDVKDIENTFSQTQKKTLNKDQPCSNTLQTFGRILSPITGLFKLNTLSVVKQNKQKISFKEFLESNHEIQKHGEKNIYSSLVQKYNAIPTRIKNIAYSMIKENETVRTKLLTSLSPTCESSMRILETKVDMESVPVKEESVSSEIGPKLNEEKNVTRCDKSPNMAKVDEFDTRTMNTNSNMMVKQTAKRIFQNIQEVEETPAATEFVKTKLGTEKLSKITENNKKDHVIIKAVNLLQKKEVLKRKGISNFTVQRAEGILPIPEVVKAEKAKQTQETRDKDQTTSKNKQNIEITKNVLVVEKDGTEFGLPEDEGLNLKDFKTNQNQVAVNTPTTSRTKEGDEHEADDKQELILEKSTTEAKTLLTPKLSERKIGDKLKTYSKKGSSFEKPTIKAEIIGPKKTKNMIFNKKSELKTQELESKQTPKIEPEVFSKQISGNRELNKNHLYEIKEESSSVLKKNAENVDEYEHRNNSIDVASREEENVYFETESIDEEQIHENPKETLGMKRRFPSNQKAQTESTLKEEIPNPIHAVRQWKTVDHDGIGKDKIYFSDKNKNSLGGSEQPSSLEQPFSGQVNSTDKYEPKDQVNETKIETEMIKEKENSIEMEAQLPSVQKLPVESELEYNTSEQIYDIIIRELKKNFLDEVIKTTTNFLQKKVEIAEEYKQPSISIDIFPEKDQKNVRLEISGKQSSVKAEILGQPEEITGEKVEVESNQKPSIGSELKDVTANRFHASSDWKIHNDDEIGKIETDVLDKKKESVIQHEQVFSGVQPVSRQLEPFAQQITPTSNLVLLSVEKSDENESINLVKETKIIKEIIKDMKRTMQMEVKQQVQSKLKPYVSIQSSNNNLTDEACKNISPILIKRKEQFEQETVSKNISPQEEENTVYSETESSASEEQILRNEKEKTLAKVGLESNQKPSIQSKRKVVISEQVPDRIEWKIYHHDRMDDDNESDFLYKKEENIKEYKHFTSVQTISKQLQAGAQEKIPGEEKLLVQSELEYNTCKQTYDQQNLNINSLSVTSNKIITILNRRAEFAEQSAVSIDIIPQEQEQENIHFQTLAKESVFQPKEQILEKQKGTSELVQLNSNQEPSIANINPDQIQHRKECKIHNYHEIIKKENDFSDNIEESFSEYEEPFTTEESASRQVESGTQQGTSATSTKEAQMYDLIHQVERATIEKVGIKETKNFIQMEEKFESQLKLPIDAKLDVRTKILQNFDQSGKKDIVFKDTESLSEYEQFYALSSTKKESESTLVNIHHSIKEADDQKERIKETTVNQKNSLAKSKRSLGVQVKHESQQNIPIDSDPEFETKNSINNERKWSGAVKRKIDVLCKKTQEASEYNEESFSQVIRTKQRIPILEGNKLKLRDQTKRKEAEGNFSEKTKGKPKLILTTQQKRITEPKLHVINTEQSTSEYSENQKKTNPLRKTGIQKPSQIRTKQPLKPLMKEVLKPFSCRVVHEKTAPSVKQKATIPKKGTADKTLTERLTEGSMKPMAEEGMDNTNISMKSATVSSKRNEKSTMLPRPMKLASIIRSSSESPDTSSSQGQKPSNLEENIKNRKKMSTIPQMSTTTNSLIQQKKQFQTQMKLASITSALKSVSQGRSEIVKRSPVCKQKEMASNIPVRISAQQRKIKLTQYVSPTLKRKTDAIVQKDLSQDKYKYTLKKPHEEIFVRSDQISKISANKTRPATPLKNPSLLRTYQEQVSIKRRKNETSLGEDIIHKIEKQVQVTGTPNDSSEKNKIEELVGRSTQTIQLSEKQLQAPRNAERGVSANIIGNTVDAPANHNQLEKITKMNDSELASSILVAKKKYKDNAISMAKTEMNKRYTRGDLCTNIVEPLGFEKEGRTFNVKSVEKMSDSVINRKTVTYISDNKIIHREISVVRIGEQFPKTENDKHFIRSRENEFTLTKAEIFSVPSKNCFTSIAESINSNDTATGRMVQSYDNKSASASENVAVKTKYCDNEVNKSNLDKKWNKTSVPSFEENLKIADNKVATHPGAFEVIFVRKKVRVDKPKNLKNVMKQNGLEDVGEKFQVEDCEAGKIRMTNQEKYEGSCLTKFKNFHFPSNLVDRFFSEPIIGYQKQMKIEFPRIRSEQFLMRLHSLNQKSEAVDTENILNNKCDKSFVTELLPKKTTFKLKMNLKKFARRKLYRKLKKMGQSFKILPREEKLKLISCLLERKARSKYSKYNIKVDKTQLKIEISGTKLPKKHENLKVTSMESAQIYLSESKSTISENKLSYQCTSTDILHQKQLSSIETINSENRKSAIIMTDIHSSSRELQICQPGKMVLNLKGSKSDSNIRNMKDELHSSTIQDSNSSRRTMDIEYKPEPNISKGLNTQTSLVPVDNLCSGKYSRHVHFSKTTSEPKLKHCSNLKKKVYSDEYSDFFSASTNSGAQSKHYRLINMKKDLRNINKKFLKIRKRFDEYNSVPRRKQNSKKLIIEAKLPKGSRNQKTKNRWKINERKKRRTPKSSVNNKHSSEQSLISCEYVKTKNNDNNDFSNKMDDSEQGIELDGKQCSIKCDYEGENNLRRKSRTGNYCIRIKIHKTKPQDTNKNDIDESSCMIEQDDSPIPTKSTQIKLRGCCHKVKKKYVHKSRFSKKIRHNLYESRNSNQNVQECQHCNHGAEHTNLKMKSCPQCSQLYNNLRASQVRSYLRGENLHEKSNRCRNSVTSNQCKINECLNEPRKVKTNKFGDNHYQKELQVCICTQNIHTASEIIFIEEMKKKFGSKHTENRTKENNSDKIDEYLFKGILKNNCKDETQTKMPPRRVGIFTRSESAFIDEMKEKFGNLQHRCIESNVENNAPLLYFNNNDDILNDVEMSNFKWTSKKHIPFRKKNKFVDKYNLCNEDSRRYVRFQTTEDKQSKCDHDTFPWWSSKHNKHNGHDGHNHWEYKDHLPQDYRSRNTFMSDDINKILNEYFITSSQEIYKDKRLDITQKNEIKTKKNNTHVLSQKYVINKIKKTRAESRNAKNSEISKQKSKKLKAEQNYYGKISYQISMLSETRTFSSVFGNSSTNSTYSEYEEVTEPSEADNKSDHLKKICEKYQSNLKDVVVFMRVDILKENRTLLDEIIGSNVSLQQLMRRAVLFNESPSKKANQPKSSS